MTVNELIAELTALREHHRCGDFEVVVEKLIPDRMGLRPDAYDHASLARLEFKRRIGTNGRVVELAPEPVNG